jgi:uncharacterized membrane protein
VNTLDGIPAHPLLVHAIVVLAPLAAVLAILCAVWPAARQRLVWLVLVLAGVNLVLTPLATNAGEWLYERTPDSPYLDTHEHLGDTMIYVSIALMVAAALLAFSHVRSNQDKSSTGLSVIVAVLVVVIGVGVTVQVFRIGHSGAKSVWSDVLEPNAAEGS